MLDDLNRDVASSGGGWFKLNRIEHGIRMYDPCLSCATHAYGQMPLDVSLFDAAGRLVSQRRK